MTRFKTYIGLAVLVAIVAALAISSAAFAQSSTTPDARSGRAHQPARLHGASRRVWSAQPGGAGCRREGAGHDFG